MTKADLVKSLEQVPDDFEVRVLTYDFYGIEYEVDLKDLQIIPEERIVLVNIEDEFY